MKALQAVKPRAAANYSSGDLRSPYKKEVEKVVEKKREEWKKEADRTEDNTVRTFLILSVFISAAIVTPLWTSWASTIDEDFVCDSSFKDCCWDYVGNYIGVIIGYLIIVAGVWAMIVLLWATFWKGDW